MPRYNASVWIAPTNPVFGVVRCYPPRNVENIPMATELTTEWDIILFQGGKWELVPRPATATKHGSITIPGYPNGYTVVMSEPGVENPLKSFPTIDEAAQWIPRVRRAFPAAIIEIRNPLGEILLTDDPNT